MSKSGSASRGEDREIKDSSQSHPSPASPSPLGPEKSPSKRRFLKTALLAGSVAGIALAMPLGASASIQGQSHKSSSTTSTSSSTSSTLKLSRVYRFIDPKTGAPQISTFPDEATSPPTGSTDLEVRMKHFTEIENFTFLGYVLSHELGGTKPRPIQAIQGLTVPDPEFQNLVNLAQTDLLNDEDLGDTLLDVGINWEHFVASENSILIPGNPLKITDTAMQAKIDSLDSIAEALVQEVNNRSIQENKGHGH